MFVDHIKELYLINSFCHKNRSANIVFSLYNFLMVFKLYTILNSSAEVVLFCFRLVDQLILIYPLFFFVQKLLEFLYKQRAPRNAPPPWYFLVHEVGSTNDRRRVQYFKVAHKFWLKIIPSPERGTRGGYQFWNFKWKNTERTRAKFRNHFCQREGKGVTHFK